MPRTGEPRRTRRRLRQGLFLAAGAAAAALALIADAGNLFRGAELSTVDARFSIRGEQKPPKDILVVEIDDETFGELEEQWPFPRSLHGKAIERIGADDPKAIGYDVQFTEPSDQVEDNALIESIRRNPGVVLATTSGAKALGSDEALAYASARAGSAEVPRDPGGYFRRLAYDVDGEKSMPVVLAEQADRVKADRFEETTWIDYRGPAGTIRRVSFSKLFEKENPLPTDFFRDKIVLVGPTSKTLQDLHPTSTSDAMSGVEVLANGVFTVRADRQLQSGPGWLSPFVVLMLAFASPAASLRASPLRALALALVLAVLFVVIAQLAFNAGLVIPIVYPLIALGVSGIATLAVHYVTAAFERERVRDLFSRFVPDDVVTELLAQTEDGELRLGGKRVECTVLFSDLRGFTSFSEAAGPEEVIDVLNHYLGEMSEAILDEGGTLTAYLGDGIMAVFGTPLPQADHADRALRAAREMLRRMEGFNAWMAAGGFDDGFKMGIGLNSGPLMVGNVGSQRRVEYTAIGDAVNTAARLEGMTKGTPYQVYIAESTRSRFSQTQYDLTLIGELEVRGRQGEVRTWALDENPVIGESDRDNAAQSSPGPSAPAEP